MGYNSLNIDFDVDNFRNSMLSYFANFRFFDFTHNYHEVIHAIKDLNNNSSIGVDRVSVFLLKFCSEFLAAPLVYIINASFQEGIFPEKIKTSLINFIHKRRYRSTINNYRLIGLISV